MMKKLFYVIILILFAVYSYGQTNFTRGEELLDRNQPAQALEFLTRAMTEDPSNVKTYIYLGIAYEQLNRMDEAINIYRLALPNAGNFSAEIASNLGNIYFKRGNFDMAEQYYSQAIGFNSVYSAAYLGRANTRTGARNLNNAIIDYEHYLILEPGTSQRINIERLINTIRMEFAAEEMRRIMAEEEERRIAEERQRLLDFISASLLSTAGSGQGVSMGSEGFESYEDEFILD